MPGHDFLHDVANVGLGHHLASGVAQVPQRRRFRDGLQRGGVQPAVLADVDVAGLRPGRHVLPGGAQLGGQPGQQLTGMFGQLHRVQQFLAPRLPHLPGQQLGARVRPP
ncbi:hypothetical protein [Actinoplanes sp. NPDC049265]|uniref:hypothetical protein n=1 Tax=Actinoplanes sp. NPDC049265 TaxID=3363902 RepID=UPI00371C6EA1